MAKRKPAADPSGRVPRRQLGQVSINGVLYPVTDLGTYVDPTTLTGTPGESIVYHAGNIVDDGAGNLWLCTATKTTLAPSAGPNWRAFDEASYALRGDRVWSTNGEWVNINDPTDMTALGYPGVPPTFVGGWINLGGTDVPMRFRKNIGGGLEIQGAITGDGSGTQITTAIAPAFFQPDYDITLPAVQSSGALSAFIVKADGTIWAL